MATAKRILLGVFFTAMSFALVQTVMAQIYGTLDQPFQGSAMAGVVYGLIHGTLSVALCQTLLVLTADRQLAATATRYAVGIYLSIIVAVLIVSFLFGAVAENWQSIWLTIVPTIPWLVAAAFARRRLVIEWSTRQDGGRDTPPGD